MITYLEVNLVGYVMGDGNYWNELAVFLVGSVCGGAAGAEGTSQALVTMQ